MSADTPVRRAGLVIPLFSCPSSKSWGIGEIPDVAPAARWLARSGMTVLQLLPLNEMAPDQHSPYTAISALAIDPIFIALDQVTDFAGVGGEQSLDSNDRDRLAAARAASRVDYEAVRVLKHKAFGIAFERFHDTEWVPDTARARAFRTFREQEAWWLDDYALFRAIHADQLERPWIEWPDALRRCERQALADARHRLARKILFFEYLQWLASEQWSAARVSAHAEGVALFGDLPFMVNGDSADVWARQSQFNFEATVGAPPDAFSATGQDWGVPVYRWDVQAADDFGWLRARSRRSAALYDGYRIDHLVGFYRTYSRPIDGSPASFTPSSEGEQLALGERLLHLFREPGAEIVAEDLGTIPEFVRESLARLGVPGFCVFRWERHWHEPDQPFRDPAEYPARSVAVSGTHDTEPQDVWWNTTPDHERRLIGRLSTIRRLAGEGTIESRDAAGVRDVLLEALYASGSNLLLLPIQDVFGWTDRINDPRIVGGENWTFRLHWPIDRLDELAEPVSRRETLRRWAAAHGRSRAEA